MAAAQIYNMLTAYSGKVTVKIDGIAASAASVIAMAGDTVLVSPVSMLMIHNPATIAWGDHAEMQKAIDMLSKVKESIINAYVLKTGLSRARLSHLMDAETWMDANKALELGFADGIIERAVLRSEGPEEEPDEEDTDGGGSEEKKKPPVPESMLFSRRAVNNALLNKLEKHYSRPKPNIGQQAQIPAENTETGRPVSEIMERLSFIKKFI